MDNQNIDKLVKDLLFDIRVDKGGWNPKANVAPLTGRVENSARIITYTLDAKQTFHDSRGDVNEITPLSREQRAAVEHVFREIEKVANVKFRLVGHIDEIDKADIRFFQGRILLPGFDMPGGGYSRNSKEIKDIIINNNQEPVLFKVGQQGYGVVAHEILHVLGLSHPGGNGTNPLYDKDITAMSYNFGKNPVEGITAIDIAALQYLYPKPIAHTVSPTANGKLNIGSPLPMSAKRHR